MAYLSKIKLPSGTTYELKDSKLWEILNIDENGIDSTRIATIEAQLEAAVAGGVTILVSSTAATTPKDVVWMDGVTQVTGTLVASVNTKNIIYFVPKTANGKDSHDEYITVYDGTNYKWEKIGNTAVDLGPYAKTEDLGTLAYKNGVSLNKESAQVYGANNTFTNSNSPVTSSGTSSDKALGVDTTFSNAASTVTAAGGESDTVLGENTTFTNSSSSVSFATHTKKSALGANATFSFNAPTVTPASTYLSVNSTGSNRGTLPTFSATVGTGADAELLTLGWTTGSLPTMPTISLATSSTNSTGAVQVGTGAASTVSGGSVVVNTSDAVSAITELGAATAAAQNITVGTNDAVTAVTSIGTLTAAAQAITVGTNDQINALTGLGTLTAAAQTITVGGNSTKVLAHDGTRITVS